jgi:hypothetical protein
MLKNFAIFGALFAILVAPVKAEETAALALSAGQFNSLDDSDSSTELGVEYRFAPLENAYNIIPVIGVSANSDGGYWAHTGIRYDISFLDNWVVTPNFAVALYERGSGKQLGTAVEFRSGLDIGYKLSPSSHLTLGIYHLSNANMSDHNPGEESVILTYSFAPNF